MKFCKFCGKQLADNEVCSCQTQAQAAAPAAKKASPYAVGGAPSVGGAKFVDALKNIPVVFVSYWTKSKEIIGVAKKTNDFILSALYCAILFLIMFGFNCCFFAAQKAFNFGIVILTALIGVVIFAGFYTLIKFVIVKMFNKQADTKNAFIGAFVEFGIHSMPVSIFFIVAAIGGFINKYVTAAIICFAVMYLIICLVSELKNDIPEIKNNFLFFLVTAVLVTAAYLFSMWVFGKLFAWSAGTSALGGLSNMLGGSSSYGSYGDILNKFL